jgi:hypothetical protein
MSSFQPASVLLTAFALILSLSLGQAQSSLALLKLIPNNVHFFYFPCSFSLIGLGYHSVSISILQAISAFIYGGTPNGLRVTGYLSISKKSLRMPRKRLLYHVHPLFCIDSNLYEIASVGSIKFVRIL